MFVAHVLIWMKMLRGDFKAFTAGKFRSNVFTAELNFLCDLTSTLMTLNFSFSHYDDL
jgi:hypothetical protein